MNANADLRSFLHQVRLAGPEYYAEVERELSPRLEPCILQEKLAKEKRYPVIMCKKIKGSDLPLVTNMFGSYELLGLALGLPAATELNKIMKEYMRKVSSPVAVKTVPSNEAPVKEIVLTGSNVDLGLLPILHHAEMDSGKYIVVGCMICKDPDTGIPNVGMYRHELKGPKTLAAMFNPAHHASYIARRYKELNKAMEVALFVGHHPAVILGALARGNMDMNEMEIMGGLLGQPLEVTAAATVNMLVPASAEIVIEGVIDPAKEIQDGPFAEYTGYYGGISKAWQIDVSAITMRRDGIYHDLDPAHREHNLSGVLCYESSVYEAVRKLVPTVQTVHLPPSGCCVNTAYVSIAKRIQGEGKLAGIAALGSEPNLKMVVVTDDDINIYDDQEVLWAITTRVEADLDVSVIKRVTGAHLDPSAYGEKRFERGDMTSKVIIDATMPVTMPFAQRIKPSAELWQKMNLAEYIK